jgi:hypothetical protein
MKRLALAMTVLLAFAVSACGKDTHESLAREAQGLMKDFAETLEKVTDVPSAKAQKPALQALVNKFEALKVRRDKLGEPTEEQLKQMMESLSKDKELEQTAMKFQAAMMRIMFDPAINAELKDIDFQKIAK